MPREPSIGRILLVDDIAMNRDLIGAVLEASGYAVILAESGRQAVQIAAKRPVDLVLMDLRMPGMDGFEAARQIRALPGVGGKVPIYAITASELPGDIQACRTASIDGKISKSADSKTLLKIVNNAILGRVFQHSATLPTHADTVPVIAEPPVRLDREWLRQTLAYMQPEEGYQNLRALAQQMDSTLAVHDRLSTLAEHADTAHAIASAAGSFGFSALSAAAFIFERSAAVDAQDTDTKLHQYRIELIAAQEQLSAVLQANSGDPT